METYYIFQSINRLDEIQKEKTAPNNRYDPPEEDYNPYSAKDNFFYAVGSGFLAAIAGLLAYLLRDSMAGSSVLVITLILGIVSVYHLIKSIVYLFKR